MTMTFLNGQGVSVYSKGPSNYNNLHSINDGKSEVLLCKGQDSYEKVDGGFQN